MIRNYTSCSYHNLLNLKLTSRNWNITPLLCEGDIVGAGRLTLVTIDGIGTYCIQTIGFMGYSAEK